MRQQQQWHGGSSTRLATGSQAIVGRLTAVAVWVILRLERIPVRGVW